MRHHAVNGDGMTAGDLLRGFTMGVDWGDSGVSEI